MDRICVGMMHTKLNSFYRWGLWVWEGMKINIHYSAIYVFGVSKSFIIRRHSYIIFFKELGFQKAKCKNSARVCKYLIQIPCFIWDNCLKVVVTALIAFPKRNLLKKFYRIYFIHLKTFRKTYVTQIKWYVERNSFIWCVLKEKNNWVSSAHHCYY